MGARRRMRTVTLRKCSIKKAPEEMGVSEGEELNSTDICRSWFLGAMPKLSNDDFKGAPARWKPWPAARPLSEKCLLETRGELDQVLQTLDRRTCQPPVCMSAWRAPCPVSTYCHFRGAVSMSSLYPLSVVPFREASAKRTCRCRACAGAIAAGRAVAAIACTIAAAVRARAAER